MSPSGGGYLFHSTSASTAHFCCFFKYKQTHPLMCRNWLRMCEWSEWDSLGWICWLHCFLLPIELRKVLQFLDLVLGKQVQATRRKYTLNCHSLLPSYVCLSSCLPTLEIIQFLARNRSGPSPLHPPPHRGRRAGLFNASSKIMMPFNLMSFFASNSF